MDVSVLLDNTLGLLKSAIDTLADLTGWLWTPLETGDLNLPPFTGTAPIMLLTGGLITAIIILHIIHLVNVIAG